MTREGYDQCLGISHNLSPILPWCTQLTRYQLKVKMKWSNYEVSWTKVENLTKKILASTIKHKNVDNQTANKTWLQSTVWTPALLFLNVLISTFKVLQNTYWILQSVKPLWRRIQSLPGNRTLWRTISAIMHPTDQISTIMLGAARTKD